MQVSDKWAIGVSILLLFLAGCTPSGCQRQEPRALFAADSVSKRIAAGVPIDSLVRRFKTRGTGESRLEHPRTVRFTKDGIVVSDTRRGTLFTFTPDGRLIGESEKLFRYPYLVGAWGDTLAVFDAGAGRLSHMREGRLLWTCMIPADDRKTLRYVAAGPGTTYVKYLPEGSGKRIVRLDGKCRPAGTTPLRGPAWRYAGFLRMLGDTLVSLSGYRPLVDRVLSSGKIDSLQLAGFDSPMLARSRAFILGTIREAPLMSPSAAVHDGRYYVLNARPGWLRVDVYNQNGRLERVLTSTNPEFNRSYYPVDVAVRQGPDGKLLIAIATSQEDPSLEVWTLK